MKVFISLLKTSLNVNFGISALRYRFTKEKNRLWEPILIALAIIFGVGSLVVMYTLLLLGVYMAGAAINRPELVLTLAFFMAQFIVLLFGIFYIMSAFYFSEDMNILVPLPLKPYQVLGSKFFVIMVNEYLILLPMLLPAIFIFGVEMHMGIAYWLKGIFVILGAPIIPLVIAAVFILILMRFVNLRKSKDLLMIIGSLLAILFAVGINYFTQRIPESNPEKFMQDILASQTGVIEAIGRKFPPSLWMTYGLSKSGLEGWGYFALYIIVCIILLAFLLWLSNQIFYKGLLSGQEVGRKKKRLSIEQIKDYSQKVSNPVIALFWKEWKLFIRTPIYAMNGLAGMIMVPFLMLMPFMVQGGEMEQLLSMARTPEFLMPATLGGLALLLFTSTINLVACTAISREGSTFWISKMIPISPRRQATAKLLHGMAISGLGILVTIVVLAVILPLPFERILIILILGSLGTFLLNILNLVIDIVRPKLEWNDPQEAVKQNLNGLFSILVTILFMALFGGLTAILFSIGCTEWLTYLILGLVMAVLTVPSMWMLYALAEKQYKNLET